MFRSLALCAFAAIFALAAQDAAQARNVFYDPADAQAAAPVERVVNALVKSSGSWCANDAKPCILDVRIKQPNAIEVFYDEQAIWISNQRLQLTRNDAELALLIGHEWAHKLLGHPNRFDENQELDADCVGALLAMRSGFDPRAGVPLYQRLARENDTDTAMFGLFGVKAGPEADWTQRIAVIERVSKTVTGKSAIDRARVERICRVELKY